MYAWLYVLLFTIVDFRSSLELVFYVWFISTLNKALNWIELNWIESPCDNRSASHWIMFDYFFSCLKSKHFFLFNYVPRLFLLACVKFIEKRSITMTHWPIFVYYPFCKWRRIAWHKVVNKSRDFVIGQPNLKSKAD